MRINNICQNATVIIILFECIIMISRNIEIEDIEILKQYIFILKSRVFVEQEMMRLELTYNKRNKELMLEFGTKMMILYEEEIGQEQSIILFPFWV